MLTKNELLLALAKEAILTHDDPIGVYFWHDEIFKKPELREALEFHYNYKKIHYWDIEANSNEEIRLKIKSDLLEFLDVCCSNDLPIEFDVYNKNLESLLAHEGKYVAISGTKIIGIFDDKEKAVKASNSSYPAEVLIQKIGEKPIAVTI